MKKQSSKGAQAGFTLIEMMVALTIGMFLVGALIVTYLGNARSSRASIALTQMSEDGQAALGILTQSLRQTGYNPRQPVTGDAYDLKLGGLTLFACDTGFFSISAAMPLLTCAAGVAPGAIAVAYLGDRFNGIMTSDGKVSDCVGSGIVPTIDTPTGASYTVVQNRFYLAKGSLMCAGNGGVNPFTTPQPLVDNVVELKVSFGVSAPTGTDTLATGYLSASEVGPLTSAVGVFNNASFIALAPVDRWGKVVSARVCVVMQSSVVVLEGGSANQPQYNDCNGILRTSSDGRLRRAFAATVLLRNRVVPS
ncbi:MAG: PilW family protein [Bdellovibrionales bacterium]|nr:PilW family protein [Ramlibacter sp.]